MDVSIIILIKTSITKYPLTIMNDKIIKRRPDFRRYRMHISMPYIDKKPYINHERSLATFRLR